MSCPDLNRFNRHQQDFALQSSPILSYSYEYFYKDFEQEYSDLTDELGLKEFDTYKFAYENSNFMTGPKLVNKEIISPQNEIHEKECEIEINAKNCQNNAVLSKVTLNDSSQKNNTILDENQGVKQLNQQNVEILRWKKISEDNETNGNSSKDSSESVPTSRRKGAGRKRLNLGLTQRKDVVLKALLRKMRTSLWEKFNSVTLFKEKRNMKGPLHYDICLRLFAREKLGELANDAFLFYLSILMSTKKTEELVSFKFSSLYKRTDEERSQQLEEISQVHEVLYKFSCSKFKRLLEKKELWTLIHHYFSTLNSSEMSQDEKICSEILLKYCRASLNL
jgi:hypothetical protein